MLILNYILYYYNFEIYKILFSIIIIIIIISLIPFLSSFLIKIIKLNDKISTYECGFEPFNDSKSQFEVKFYLVSILFIIFDLEIIIIFPWIFLYNPFNFIIILFIIILLIGFIYEYINKALDW